MSFNSIFIKLFLIFSLGGVIVLAGLFYSNVSSAQRAMYDQKSEEMRLHIERTGLYLDLYLQNITDVLFSISRVERLLTMESKAVEQVLKQVKSTHSTNIGSIFIINNDQQIISSDQLNYNIIGHPQVMKLYDIAFDNYGGINWSEPYYSPLQVGQTIAFVLPMKNAVGQVEGVIALEIDLKSLEKKLGSFLYNTGQSFVVLSSQGSVVAFDKSGELDIYENRKNPNVLNPTVIEALVNSSSGLVGMTFNESDLMIIKSKRNGLGWNIISLTDSKVFRTRMNELLLDSIRIGLIGFAFLLLFTYLISRHFTRPIKHLALQMDRIKDDRFTFKVNALKRKDEIGILFQSFSHLMKRIRDLIEMQKNTEERKRKVELKMLLSQIRPHFLYNTLICIGSLAQQRRLSEVEDTIRSLIFILTFSIDKKEDIVSLNEELECLEAFVQIQKVRYGDIFTFITNVSPELQSVRIPKLILQPIVENAIFHGIADQENGVITVEAIAKDSNLYIHVKDNGRGFAPERLAEFNQTSKQVMLPAKGKGLNSMGISNEKERIQLLYGEPYGITVRSAPSEGTDIILCLPM